METGDARAVLQLLHALYVSADEHRPVMIAEGSEYAPLGAYDEDLWTVYES